MVRVTPHHYNILSLLVTCGCSHLYAGCHGFIGSSWVLQYLQNTCTTFKMPIRSHQLVGEQELLETNVEPKSSTWLVKPCPLCIVLWSHGEGEDKDHCVNDHMFLTRSRSAAGFGRWHAGERNMWPSTRSPRPRPRPGGGTCAASSGVAPPAGREHESEDRMAFVININISKCYHLVSTKTLVSLSLF